MPSMTHLKYVVVFARMSSMTPYYRNNGHLKNLFNLYNKDNITKRARIIFSYHPKLLHTNLLFIGIRKGLEKIIVCTYIMHPNTVIITQSGQAVEKMAEKHSADGELIMTEVSDRLC